MFSNLGLTVSATTRPPREGEVDGVSYYFLTDDEFTSKVEAGEFLEWANVHDHRYGTLLSEVQRNIEQDLSVLMEIDVQGGLAVREKYPDAVLVFIEPPSLEVLEERLRGRGTEDDATIALRLGNAIAEMELGRSYDYRIVNDDLDQAVSDLAAIIEGKQTCEKD